MKTSEASRLRNRAFRTTMRSAIKELRAENNKDEAVKKLKATSILLDQASAKHLIHRKNADRNKSRLAAMVNKLG